MSIADKVFGWRDLSWPIRGQCSGHVTTHWPIRGQDGWRGGGWWRRVSRVWGQHLRGGDHQLRDLHQVRAVTRLGWIFGKRSILPTLTLILLRLKLNNWGRNNNPFSRWFHFTCVGVDHGDACVQSEFHAYCRTSTIYNACLHLN